MGKVSFDGGGFHLIISMTEGFKMYKTRVDGYQQTPLASTKRLIVKVSNVDTIVITGFVHLVAAIGAPAAP